MDLRFALEVGSTLCLQISIVIAMTAALQRWVVDARWGCRLWTTCFLCIIGLVAAALLLPHRRLFHFPVTLSRESMLEIVVWQTRIAIALLSVWTVGAVWSIVQRCWLCIGLLQFLRHECDPIDAAELLQATDISSNECQPLSICVSDKIQGPFCWQLHRPVVVLPSFMINDHHAGDATLRHVLLHELEHLRTQHPMQHFLQGICSTLFWFHPMVRSAAHKAELTREFLCDEVAATTIGKFSAYLRTLAKVAEQCRRQPCNGAPKGTLAFGNDDSTLIRRSKRLVMLAENKPARAHWRAIMALTTILLCATLVQQVWLPTNVMASQRSDWSPWPSWTAKALHQFNLQVRDFESFEDRVQMHELLTEED
ncbi:M56 family metallopeptidase [Rhodopirellula islandica]|nr:M56 family metallopeptidase [Rhodopirellula islandica]